MSAVVSREALWVALDLVEHNAAHQRALLDGIAAEHATRRGRAKVPWDVYVTVVERLEELVGGPEALEGLVVSAADRLYPRVRALARHLVSPELFIPALSSYLSKNFPIESEIEFLEPRHFRWKIRLDRKARPCLALMRATVGTARTWPCYLGLAPAEVDADLTPTGGTFDLRLPRSPLLVQLMENAVHASRDALSWWTGTPRKHPIVAPLTTAELEQMHRIGRRLAECGDRDAMLEETVAMLCSELGYAEASVWRYSKSASGSLELLRRRGKRGKDASCRLYTLRIASREIGRLEVRGGERSRVIEAALPWFSLALQYALGMEPSSPTLAARVDLATARWQLSLRQIEILARVAQGMSNKEIGADLGLSVKTVELYVRQLFDKANVESRAQLTALLFSIG